MNDKPILEVRSLQKKFSLEAGFFSRYGKFVYAVNDVSFDLYKGETYGLVGESGCGKTTTARCIVRMYKNDGGSILFRAMGDSALSDSALGDSAPAESGTYQTEPAAQTPHPAAQTKPALPVEYFSRAQLRSYREKVKYVFQDPARSLDPRMTVFDVLVSGYRWSSRWPGRKKAREEAAAILIETGLSAEDLDRRPASFSGGQRQRISIARGLLMHPQILICDEVVSALDVSIQGQILNLLQDIREKRGLSMLFIAHDLKAACYFCDRIGVMYRGQIVEEGPARTLYTEALHPYTKLLFASSGHVPLEMVREPEIVQKAVPLEMVREPEIVQKAVPLKTVHVDSGAGSLSGCVFAERCPLADENCTMSIPPLRPIDNTYTRKVRCFKV